MSQISNESHSNRSVELVRRTPNSNPKEWSERDDVPPVEEYWRIAVSAFQYEHSKSEVRAHTVETDILVSVVVDDQVVGFCSCDMVDELTEPAIYLNGAAIAASHQNQGLGEEVMKLAVEMTLDHYSLERAVVFGTTQNPAIVSLLEQTFGLYPRPSAAEPLPPEAVNRMKPLASYLNPDKQFEPPVIRCRYGGNMIYDSIPDHPYREYTDRKLEYESGDALLCAGVVERDSTPVD